MKGDLEHPPILLVVKLFADNCPLSMCYEAAHSSVLAGSPECSVLGLTHGVLEQIHDARTVRLSALVYGIRVWARKPVPRERVIGQAVRRKLPSQMKERQQQHK